MHYTNLGMGLFMMLIGWLIYRYPKFINPYGGMSPDRQALVDIDGLKKALALSAGVAGLLLVVLFALGISHIVSEDFAGYSMAVILLAMLIPMFIAMRKYNGFGRDASGKSYMGHPIDKTSKWALVILVFCVVLPVVMILVYSKPATISLDYNGFKTNGVYGVNVRYGDIVSMEVLEKMPPMEKRVNGSYSGGVSKGLFLTKEGEKCLLFVNYNGGPYIEIRTADRLIYMNCPSREQTLEVISRLQEVVGQNELSGR